MKQPVCFYTFVSDNYYEPVGTPMLINSFKKFHPEIPLIIFRNDIVDKIIIDKGSVNWLNAKPMFAKLLTDKYELVVNVDADSVCLDRLDEVLTGDFDICSVMNKNDYESVSVENVTEEMFLQAGFIGSRRPEFWDMWMAVSLRDNWKYRCAENDTMNLVIYNQLLPAGWKLKILDKDKDYWGCKILGREKECRIVTDRVVCRGERVKMYHAAKGPANLPKLTTDKLQGYGFTNEVIDYINYVGKYGTSELYGQI